jgi:hypothetical protein
MRGRLELSSETESLPTRATMALRLRSNTGNQVISLKRLSNGCRLFPAHVASGQMPLFVIVFDYLDSAAFVGITLDDRQRTVGPERLYRFGSPVVVVVANLANHDARPVFLNQIDLAVEVAITTDLDQLVSIDGLDEIRLSVAVGINRDLILLVVAPRYPLVGPAVAVPMRDGAIGRAVTGAQGESR